MRATRRTQPYRQGPRTPGPALSAMLKGGPQSLQNPMDIYRRTMRGPTALGRLLLSIRQ